jgi:hypothetical protein
VPAATAEPTTPSYGPGTIFYTIDAGTSLYLAKTSPTSSQGEVLDPTTPQNSTCSGSEAKTLVGDSFPLFYRSHCSARGPSECPSPDGQFKIVIWGQGSDVQLTVRRASDGEIAQATYNGRLNNDEGIVWAPDSQNFYFVIGNELHRASPHEPGYQPVANEVTDFQLSPDGSMAMYLKPVGAVGAYDIMVVNATGARGTPVNVTNAPDTTKMCPRWGR